MDRIEDVLDFWLNEVGEKGWYIPPEGLDDKIRQRFEDLWSDAQKEGHMGWSTAPRSMLALLILLDQFPRNMFRGDGKSFSTDKIARNLAKKAISKGFDMRVPEPERQFFYLPLMHSECLEDQDRCVRLILDRLPESGTENLLHAKAHREVIRRFGRFPTRNEWLGRPSTPRELEYLDSGGYGGIVNELRAAA